MKSKIRTVLFYALCITGFCISANVQAIDDKTPLEESESDDDSLVEIEGLLIDRTLTRLGKDFYFTFAMKMNNEYGDLEVNLTISEVPTALSGSIITIHHFDRVIYKTALSPGRYQAEQRAEEAMYATRNYIIKWKTEKQFQDTFDLERSEL
ncbi:MAG: curli production assembly/transport component CsgE [Moritella dasanensis]|jgi:curli production assembly/transport component CsgE